MQLLGHLVHGKSTMLHILGGVDRPTSGKLYIKGEDVYSLNNDELAIFRRRNIGLIYQFYNLIPILNVEENISLPVLLDGKKVDEKRLQEIIKTLGLEERIKHLPNELSGGQQQRLCIARAIAMGPDILLMDEPCSALDPISTLKVEETMLELKKKYTIIIVTHNMQQASRASDYTAFFHMGHVIEYDKTKNIFTNPRIQATEDYISGNFG